MDIESHYHLTDKLRAEIEEIYPKIFDHFHSYKFFKKFEYHTNFLLLMAYVEGRPVGFKFGYGQDHDLFYSWTGGVLKDYRGQGIAKLLMKTQHEWCKKNHYSRVETRTRNKFPEMLSLNIKSGFQIVGTLMETDGNPKIIMRKELSLIS